MKLDDVSEFMNSNMTCILATVGGSGAPGAARVGFSHDKEFRILIATNESTRKYKNLLANPKVALVVGDSKDTTLQYEGIAKNISMSQLGQRLELHYEKLPGARNYLNKPGQAFFLINPTWLRFTTEYGPNSQIFETENFSSIQEIAT